MKALNLTSIQMSTKQVEYSICLASYVADVGFPGKILCKLNS